MKLRKWVKVVLLVILCYSLISLFTKKETVIEEGKNYTCYGSWIMKICSGENYDYSRY